MTDHPEDLSSSNTNIQILNSAGRHQNISYSHLAVNLYSRFLIKAKAINAFSSLYLNREGFTKYGEVRVQHSVLHQSEGLHLLFAPHTKNFDCAIFCLTLQSPQVTHNPSGLMDPSLTNVLWPSPQIISNAQLTALQIENHRSGLDDWFICKVVNFHKYL